MTPGIIMAITGSAPSGAAPAATTAGNAGATPGGEGAAAPADFLGMLGTLVQASAQTLAQAAAQSAPPPAVQALAELAATTAPVLAEVISPIAAEPTTPVVTAPGAAATTEDTDPSSAPEAAASAAAVLAQMLAASQPPAPANTAPNLNANAKPLDRASSSSGAVTAGAVDTAATLAPRVAALQAQPPLAMPATLSGAAVPLEEAPALRDDEPDVGTPEAGASTSPKPAAATAATLPGAFEALLARVNPSAPAKTAESVDSVGFRSLAALLGARPQTAESRLDAAPTSGEPQTQALQGLMPQATTVATADARAADTTPERLRDPVGSAKWADALGARLMLMATRGEQQGSLRLSPEHLGPLEVQIRVQDDKATVWFGAQHADTRAALQDALPRLREMFVSSGMQLGDAGVSREAPRQDRTPAEFLSRGTVGENGTAEELSLPAAAVSAVHVGLLDTYA